MARRKSSKQIDFAPIEFYAIRFPDLEFFSTMQGKTEVLTCIDIASMRKYDTPGVARLIRSRMQKWYPDEKIKVVHVRQYAPEEMTVEQILFPEDMAVGGAWKSITKITPVQAEAIKAAQPKQTARQENTPDPYGGRYKTDQYGFLSMVTT